jgi:hypothetical protein
MCPDMHASCDDVSEWDDRPWLGDECLGAYPAICYRWSVGTLGPWNGMGVSHVKMEERCTTSSSITVSKRNARGGLGGGGLAP